MINEPFFQTNILQQIIINLSFYLFYNNWIYYVLPALLGLTAVAGYLNKFFDNNGLFPNSDDTKLFKPVFVLLALAIGIYGLVIFSLEQSLFINADMMGPNVVKTFYSGRIPFWGNMSRLAPLENFDTNFIFAITHHLSIINTYVFLQLLLIIYLVYKVFDFISPTKRILLLSLIILAPSVFWLNSIIFPERWGFVFILASFLYLKKKNLVFFTLFMNLAIYTKESYIFIYMGSLGYLLLVKFYYEEIGAKTFIEPLKSMKKFPLETMIGLSCLVFLTFYALFAVSITGQNYMSKRTLDLMQLLFLYKIEIVINVVAIGYFFKNIKFKKYLLLDGLFICATAFNILMLFVLGIAPWGDFLGHKSYYLAISTIFNLVYVVKYMKTNVFYIIFMGFFIVTNMINYRIEPGKYYREVFNFFDNKTVDGASVNIFLAPVAQFNNWIIKTWSTSYKYYLPNRNITFATSYDSFIETKLPDEFYPLKKQTELFPTDYFVFEKSNKVREMLDVALSHKHKVVFENQHFIVYYIEE